MKPLVSIFSIFFLILLFGFSNGISWATPSSQALYSEFDLGGGLWRYDYTLYNRSDPIPDAGFDLFDFFLNFDVMGSFTMISLPTGWGINAGDGFADIFSSTPGPFPIGTDIAPGASLSGFSFTFNYRAGDLPFETLFVDPSGDPVSYSGATASVPEPSTMILLSGGVAGLGYLRVRKLLRSSNRI